MSTREERQAGIDAAVFRTITGEDWRRAIAEARAMPNAVRDRINRTKQDFLKTKAVNPQTKISHE